MECEQVTVPGALQAAKPPVHADLTDQRPEIAQRLAPDRIPAEQIAGQGRFHQVDNNDGLGDHLGQRCGIVGGHRDTLRPVQADAVDRQIFRRPDRGDFAWPDKGPLFKWHPVERGFGDDDLAAPRELVQAGDNIDGVTEDIAAVRRVDAEHVSIVQAEPKTQAPPHQGWHGIQQILNRGSKGQDTIDLLEGADKAVAEEFHPGTMVLFAKPAGVLEKIAQDRGCNEIAFLSDQGSGPGHVAVQERQRLTKVRVLHF